MHSPPELAHRASPRLLIESLRWPTRAWCGNRALCPLASFVRRSPRHVRRLSALFHPLYRLICLITALGFMPARVMMSRALLKWHTPKWIYQFSADVLKIVVENARCRRIATATIPHG